VFFFFFFFFRKDTNKNYGLWVASTTI